MPNEEVSFWAIRFYTFTTYHRTHLFVEPALRAELERLLSETCATQGFELLAQGVTSDHVHLLIRHDAELPAADVMRLIKGRVARLFFLRHKELSFEPNHLWVRGFHSKRISARLVPEYVAYCKGQYTPDGTDKRLAQRSL